jgi:dTDP-4-amino-4,6-dideoxygalactose transaminase
MSKEFVPFFNLEPIHSILKDQMQEAFNRVYDSNWLVMGKELEAFETEYAIFNEVEYNVEISNGLDALYLALEVLGVGSGDEVIVPSNTYIATVLAVTRLEATPVFVEPRWETYNINPDEIEKAITHRTNAVMPVYLYGQTCEMDAIMQIAERYNLYVVEDNVQAHGARWNGKRTGSWGHVNATSFYPGKNLGALGDGGAITTNSEEIADKVRMYRNYGTKEKYYNQVAGDNMRLDELQAAFLIIKLRQLENWTHQRQEIASRYDEKLKGTEDLILPKTSTIASHSFHLYAVRTTNREAVQNYLKDNGINTLIHYPVPPHLQKAYGHLKYGKGDFPIAEEMAQTVLSLSLWVGMSEEDIKNSSLRVLEATQL